MVTSISSVANKLHPTNHLTYSKEAQDLGTKYPNGHHLLSTHIPRSAEDRLCRRRTATICGLIESSGRVSKSIDEWL